MNPRRACLAAAAAAVLAATPAAATAQFPGQDPNIVDRVVAIVGDSVVLLSQVQEEIQRLQMQGQQIPTDPVGQERLYDEVVDTWVNRVLVLQAAAKDTLIQVDEEAVQEAVAAEIQRRTQAFGGQAALQQALEAEGITLAGYREILSSQIRQEQIQRLYMQRRLQGAPAVVVTEEELRAAFDRSVGALGERPRLYSFHQVVVAPAPSDSAQAQARTQAQAILDSLVAGADFEEMAQRYSQDPGSAANGGDLGWFRRGQMVREFEDVAFGLRDGQTSGLVETEFGFHIIRVERSRIGERQARHILVIPGQTQADVERARALAESVAAQARAGIDMGGLYDRYSDPEAPDTLMVTEPQLQELPPGYDQLRGTSAGDVIGPVEYEAARGEVRFAVVKVREVREPGAYTFEDLEEQLQAQITQQKQLERIIEELKERTHVALRM